MAWIVIILLGVLAVWLYFKFFKLLKIKNVFFVDGAPGAGKTFLCVNLSIRKYKSVHRSYKFKKFLLRFLSFIPAVRDRVDNLEEPVLYSNMPLRGVNYTLLTKDLLLRRDFRFAYGSVILIDEISLMADQFDFRDKILSERLKNFFKLIRHETKGGYLICSSQTKNDLHYSIKSVLSDYIYIHSLNAVWPFFAVLRVQEMAYTADNDVVNVRAADIEETNKLILVPKRYFRRYDTYYLSSLTDFLPVYVCNEYQGKNDSLKSKILVTFNHSLFLEGEITLDKSVEVTSYVSSDEKKPE